MKLRHFLAIGIGLSLWASTAPNSQAIFSDVPGNHPNRTAIDYVESEGIVSGYPDGSYQPDRLLNRAEFTKIIIESRFDENSINTCLSRNGFYQQSIFSDIESGVWFEKYVCAARAQQIIEGYADGTFRATQGINFAEAAKIVIESYGLRTAAAEPWFAPYLNRLDELNATPTSLVAIGDQTQRGITALTRGQMAELIYRLRGVQNKVTSPDGSFSLDLPETALPPGIAASDISINLVSKNPQPVQEDNDAPIVFYELEPDGLKFPKPVQFNVTTATQSNAIPLVFLVSGDSFEVLSDPIIEIDQSSQTAKLSAELQHFSVLAIGFADLFHIGDVTVEPFDEGVRVISSVERSTGSTGFSLGSGSDRVQILDEWGLSGVFKDLGTTLSPPWTFNPYQQTYSGPRLIDVQGAFGCPFVGETAQVEYETTIGIQFQHQNRQKSSDIYLRVKSDPFSCTPMRTSEELQARYAAWRIHALNTINTIRNSNGLEPLTTNPLLTEIASIHSRDMALVQRELSHIGSLGEGPATRIREGKVIDLDTLEYQYLFAPSNIAEIGENIHVRNVYEFGNSVEEAITDLFTSYLDESITENRDNMLSNAAPFSEIGIGLYLDQNNVLWITENYISTNET